MSLFNPGGERFTQKGSIMFFSVSLRDALGVPSTKVPISVTAFTSYVFPAVICYIVAAVLAVTPRTRIIRATSWPVIAMLAMRAALSVDMSRGDPELRFLNVQFVFFMICISVSSLSWASAKKPLVRYLRAANSSPSIIMDALDLTTNLRGHGWDWSRGLYIPRETRPTNRIAFVFYVLLCAAVQSFTSAALCIAIQTFTTGAGFSIQGSTIFDETLPFFVRCLRASLISILTANTAHVGTQFLYNLFTVFGILLLRQDPAQWPPAFDNPWRATSLCDFWGRRWHQMYRQTFLLGAYPFTVVFGRVGTVIGAFLSSGILHHLLLIVLDSRSEMWRMLVGFGMMAPGVLAERAFYRSTGKKVGGVVGWIWTMTWLLLWGNVIVDGFARVGLLAPSSAIDSQSPLSASIQSLVTGFDAWLHTI